MNETYLYPYSAQEARTRNQLPMWRESYHANVACRNAIEETIRQSFDGMHLKKDCLEPVLAEYGYKRTEWVLATTLLNEAARSLFRREDGLRFFEELKKRIGGQYIELYLPAYDRLLSMLRCLCFRLDKTWSEDALRLYAMLLQRWLYMNNVRAACPELLTRLRPPYTCKRLYDQLLSNGEADRLSRYGDALLAAAPAPPGP